MRNFCAVFEIFDLGNTVEVGAESNALFSPYLYYVREVFIHAFERFSAEEIGAEIYTYNSAAVGGFFYEFIGEVAAYVMHGLRVGVAGDDGDFSVV